MSRWPVPGDRPLTARSVLASTLLGAQPPELPVAHLVGVAGLFGINENRARVALSRMVASGEATTDGSGRYRLAGHLLERQHRQDVGRAGVTGTWSGNWHVVVLDATARPARWREYQRRALSRARLGEVRQGVWARPDNHDPVLDVGATGVLVRFVGSPDGLGELDSAGLARRLWDVDAWHRRAEELVHELRSRPTRTSDDLAPGFVLSAAVLRHLAADPLLAVELLPRPWAGTALRDAYGTWDARYREVLVEYTGRVVAGATGAFSEPGRGA
ncbi:MAG: PaaX domain-containing protein, C- domain protein [Acidimicrobiales bacterium]